LVTIYPYRPIALNEGPSFNIEEGVLGLKDLYLVNLYLLHKWTCMILHQGEGVWREITRSRYGGMFPSPHLGGRLGELRSSSLWWKKASLLRAKEGSRLDWFTDVVVLKVGNNITASFWFDPWVEGSSFTDRVVDMGYWVGDKWEWDFRWKREMSMGELVLLKEFVLVVEAKAIMNSFDAWSWNLDINGVCC
jgi:hypothetical protein